MADSAPVPTAPPPAAPELTDEEKKAAKRKEIEAKLAALKLTQEKEADQKATFFGEHGGITCDGCGVSPVVGYRYKCKDCANHDICENCYDAWKGGKVTNGLGKQVISPKPEDHRFKLHKDKAFSSLIKGDQKDDVAAPKGPKCKPNEPCPCGSSIKFKKCCALKQVQTG